jgi:hypothetical protein
MLREGREHARFAGVANYLERVPIECSHELFHDSERASQKAASFLDTSRLIVVEKENAARAWPHTSSRRWGTINKPAEPTKPHCVKGKPCGNSCIAMDKVCRS